MFDEKSYSLKMDKAIEVFSKELSSLRTGRANVAMLDLVKVDVYGQQMPINQIGSITTPEPRVINIQIWDTNNIPLVDAAIKKSDLGLNLAHPRANHRPAPHSMQQPLYPLYCQVIPARSRNFQCFPSPVQSPILIESESGRESGIWPLHYPPKHASFT